MGRGEELEREERCRRGLAKGGPMRLDSPAGHCGPMQQLGILATRRAGWRTGLCYACIGHCHADGIYMLGCGAHGSRARAEVRTPHVFDMLMYAYEGGHRILRAAFARLRFV